MISNTKTKKVNYPLTVDSLLSGNQNSFAAQYLLGNIFHIHIVIENYVDKT